MQSGPKEQPCEKSWANSNPYDVQQARQVAASRLQRKSPWGRCSFWRGVPLPQKAPYFFLLLLVTSLLTPVGIVLAQQASPATGNPPAPATGNPPAPPAT